MPDVAAIAKVFDYEVPAELDDQVRVGTLVRIDLHGRRVGGWVVAEREEPPEGVTLRPIRKVTGWGPPPDVVDLAKWAAWRWAGPVSAFLGAASPPGAVRGLPARPAPPSAPPAVVGAGDVVAEAFRRRGAVLRLPPAADVFPVVATAAARGPALVVTPSVTDAAHLAMRLERSGVPVALLPREWAKARAGGCTVVGARTAAWAPLPDPQAVVVVDGHDEALQDERSPTWNARDVAIERARRAGVPCVVTSPCPDLELLAWRPALTLPRREERDGWPILDVVDRRSGDPRTGLFSERLASLVRTAPKVVCVLNRKGRATLLACAACGEVARCEACGASVAQTDDGLRCRRCATVRPTVCAACGSTALKTLRMGVSRARDELEALAGRPVGEITGDSDAVPDAPVVIGTEAVLHRLSHADVVAFLDFDQELLAPRYRAAEEALALLARAGRIAGGRSSGGRVLVQTRLPHHDVVQAALHGDPGRLVPPESATRTALRLPPVAAVAVVSGAAAPAYLEQLRSVEGVEVLGPDGGRFLVRAPDRKALSHALAAVSRPPGRVRVEVDPMRA